MRRDGSGKEESNLIESGFVVQNNSNNFKPIPKNFKNHKKILKFFKIYKH
jgi:hypothetical protein